MASKGLSVLFKIRTQLTGVAADAVSDWVKSLPSTAPCH